MIIWNTDDVFLDDVNPFTGDPSSDIYVKGLDLHFKTHVCNTGPVTPGFRSLTNHHHISFIIFVAG